MAGIGSFPYAIVMGLVTVAVCAYLFMIFDANMTTIFATEAWTSGSERTMEGRESFESFWNYTMVFIVTATGTSVLLASRRRA